MMRTSRVGRYRLERKLGGGGMGDVYRAVDEETGVTVALKVLAEQRAKDGGMLARFRREWEILREVSHPNVVALLDWPRDDTGLQYFAMELLEGETLGSHVRARGRIDLELARDVLRDVAGGLDAVHAAGIIHRDIKPENVFLVAGDRRRAKILDFGLARVQKSQITGTGVLVGTPSYVAPEQITGDEVDARADIYALGVVMYQAIAGHHPFASEDQVVTLGHHLLSPPPPLSWLREDVPRDLEALVLGMLRKRPGDRPASMAAVLAALAEAERAPHDEQAGDESRASNPPDDRYGPLNPLAESLVRHTLARKGFKPSGS
jgi:serine/threonine-protein kinase